MPDVSAIDQRPAHPKRVGSEVRLPFEEAPTLAKRGAGIGAISGQRGAFCRSSGAPCAVARSGVKNTSQPQESTMRTLRCDPKLFEQDLKGCTYIVTGGSSGAGLATVEQLVRQGAQVVVACRRVAAGEEATKHLASERGTAEVMALDLSSLASVRRFVSEFKAKHQALHGLVNHSGEYYSQNSILYADKASRAGGWPMRSPNPKVYDDQLAEQLYQTSLKLVGYGANQSARS
jgi:hypothetical protein